MYKYIYIYMYIYIYIYIYVFITPEKFTWHERNGCFNIVGKRPVVLMLVSMYKCMESVRANTKVRDRE